MRAHAAILVCISAMAMALTLSMPVHAAIDPAKAEADVRAAVQEKTPLFCTHPNQPLSPKARALCPLAREIPGCEALVAACEPKAETSRDFSFLGSLGTGLIWALVIGLCLLLLGLLTRAVIRLRKDLELADELPASARPVERRPEVVLDVLTPGDADVLLRRAEAETQRGDRGAAILLYLGAALRALDHRGLVRLARHRTNGEYLRSCQDKGARADLREIVREADEVQFGARVPSDEALRQVAARATALVRALPVALLALVMMLGCGSGAPGGDPGGDDLLRELLTRQGMVISAQRGPLATLPLPKDGEVTPVLLIDASQVMLDDETSRHLMAWVRAGGVLVLAGSPWSWPSELDAKGTSAGGREVLVTSYLNVDEELEPRVDHAHLARPEGVSWPKASPLGEFADGILFAGRMWIGEGKVLGMSRADLLTNAGLARPGNAAALMALLSTLDRNEIRIARPEEGTAPADNPITALVRAGFGLGLLQGAFAVVVLFLAFGIRFSRPIDAPPPPRRSFVEHVVAAGALWARRKLGPHALAVYAHHVDERIRARLPRGMAEPSTFLAARAKADPADVASVWKRAMGTKSDDIPVGDELTVLKRLRALYVAALRREA